MSSSTQDPPSRDDWLSGRLRTTYPVARHPLPVSRARFSADVLPRYRHGTIEQPAVSHPKAAPSPLSEHTNPTLQIERVNQSNYLKRSLVQSGNPAKTNFRRHSIHSVVPSVLVVMAMMLFSIGLYVGVTGLKASHIAQAQAASLTKAAVISATTSTHTTPTTSHTPTSTAVVANYVVAPNLPRYITIPRLGINARVLSVGVATNGALKTPNNVYDTAWYNGSAQPGQPGAMVIDGHVSSWTAQGVFYSIKTLLAGDQIKIQRGDGKVFAYGVVRTQLYPSGNVDMAAVMSPVIAGQPGLNLITCAGDVIPGTSEYNERIVVYATLQQ